MSIKIIIFSLSLGFLCACSFNDSPGPLEDPALALELLERQQSDTSTVLSTTFIQMSDTQFGMFEKPLIAFPLGLDWGDDEYERETLNFEKAISFANSTKPAFVIICGDLVNVREHQGQVKEFKRVSQLLNPEIPLYLVSGNHGVDNEPSEKSLAAYRETHGKDWYSFQQGNIYGIVVNSSLILHPEDVPEEAAAQRAWLEDELARIGLENVNGDKHILVFQHHPFLVDEPEDAGKNKGSSRRRTREHLALLNANGVHAVIAGHLHENKMGQYKNLPIIATSAIGMPSPFGSSRSGLRVVQTKAQQISHAFIAIADLP